MIAIRPGSSWPCDDCKADYLAGAETWREVSANFYDQMRGAVPPICLGQGLPGFAVGEPFDHGPLGAVHLVLAHVGSAFYARHLPVRNVRGHVETLRLHLTSNMDKVQS